MTYARSQSPMMWNCGPARYGAQLASSLSRLLLLGPQFIDNDTSRYFSNPTVPNRVHFNFQPLS